MRVNELVWQRWTDRGVRKRKREEEEREQQLDKERRETGRKKDEKKREREREREERSLKERETGEERREATAMDVMIRRGEWLMTARQRTGNGTRAWDISTDRCGL